MEHGELRLSPITVLLSLTKLVRPVVENVCIKTGGYSVGMSRAICTNTLRHVFGVWSFN